MNDNGSKTELTEIRVTYHDSDKMGHAYYSRYLVWFEIGRTEWIRRRGVSYRELEERGIFLPVRDCQVRYHAPAMYDDLIVLRTELTLFKPTRLEFAYRVERKIDARLLAEGTTVHPFVNAARKVIRVAPELLQLPADFET